MNRLIQDLVIIGLIAAVIGGATWVWEHYQATEAIIRVVKEATK